RHGRDQGHQTAGRRGLRFQAQADGVGQGRGARARSPLRRRDLGRLINVSHLTDLLSWWERNGRDLPWRRTRDPWAVLVSETMLQQTQVPRVESRFGEFLAQFPTPSACAAASAGAVVTAWAGLGYNRRALNLHRCATAVV